MADQVRALISRRRELHRAFRSHNDLWMYGCTTVFLFREEETIIVEMQDGVPVLDEELNKTITGFCPRCWGNG